MEHNRAVNIAEYMDNDWINVTYRVSGITLHNIEIIKIKDIRYLNVAVQFSKAKRYDKPQRTPGRTTLNADYTESEERLVCCPVRIIILHHSNS